MNTAKAAEQMISDIRSRKPRCRVQRKWDGRGTQHAMWMLHEIAYRKVEGEKAHRWLGYAQGVLVQADFITLEKAKLTNKES